MFKLKYYSLNKEEKEKLKKEFYQTSFGNSINKLLRRILLMGIFGLIFSIYMYFTKTYNWELYIAIVLLEPY